MLRVVYECCAGLDVHKKTVVACVLVSKQDGQLSMICDSPGPQFPRRRPELNRAIVGPIIVALALLCTASASQGALPGTAATQRGRGFLAGLLDPELGLLPEYRGAKVYWLYHDNYLAAKVLSASHPEIARTIRSAIEREGIRKSGKIELLFGEAEKPFPFRQHQLIDVRRATNGIVRTEVVTGAELKGWEQYADLQLMACIAETNQPAARQHWNVAMRFWDGKGFLDAAAKDLHRYSTYKLGLALIAASHLSPRAQLPDGLLDRLQYMQDASGGWVTDYDATGRKIGVANVETTCLAILGIEALAR